MDELKPEPDPGVRLIGVIAGTMALWAISFLTAIRVLSRDPASPVLRGAMVVIAVLGFASWILATAYSIRAQDEFNQRVHLVALAWAFAITGLFVCASDMLMRAHFVDYVSLLTVWVVMVVTWWLSMMITARYYR